LELLETPGRPKYPANSDVARVNTSTINNFISVEDEMDFSDAINELRFLIEEIK